MEHDMDRYLGFASGTVAGKRHKEQESIELEELTRGALVQRSSALAALAVHLTAQNEKMVAGMAALSAGDANQRSPEVDYIARNKTNVSSSRPLLDRKEQALITRAEVMAAAAKNLDGGDATAYAPRARCTPVPSRTCGLATTRLSCLDSEEELVKAALAEIEHGQTMTAFEAKTRRAPPRSC